MRERDLPRTGVHEQDRRAKDGADRSYAFWKAHRNAQHLRVAPALPALAEKRKAVALKRVNRWRYKSAIRMHLPHLMPGHIRAMAKECGL